jgi:hypothetical protein
MDAAFMQLKQHERGIHTIRSVRQPPGRGPHRTPPATAATHVIQHITGHQPGPSPGTLHTGHDRNPHVDDR